MTVWKSHFQLIPTVPTLGEFVADTGHRQYHRCTPQVRLKKLQQVASCKTLNRFAILFQASW